jgi:periplasmic protein TonB
VVDPLHYEPVESPDFDEADDFDGVYESAEEGRPQSLKTGENSAQDKILKYCLIASVVLHIAFFTGMPRLMEITPSKQPLLRPGEKVTSVRLVEPTQEEKRPEPPPEQASAISDRDHTALKERIPKAPPMPQPPLGKIEPRQRMASLVPPVAPEDLTKHKEEKEAEKKEEPKEGRLKPSPRKPTDHPESRLKKPPHNRPVDLRPTPQDLRDGFRAGGAKDFFPDGDVEEAVVDINTREDRFFSYLMQLKNKIQRVWVYPAVAARAGIGGSLTVEFSIAKTGHLLEVNLLDSSGQAILDESAINAIKTAAPYWPFPERLRAQRLRIRANFVYMTSSSFLRSIM